MDFPALEASTLESLEWRQLLAALHERLQSPYGRAAAARLTFLDDPGRVCERLALVAELQALRASLGPLGLGTPHAIEPELEHAEKAGTLDALALREVLQTQRAAERLAERLRMAQRSPAVAALAGALRPLPHMCETLEAAFTAEGELDGRVYPELARLRTEIAARRESIHRRLDALLRRKELAQALQEPIYTLRGTRYVVPVKADFRGAVPGLVHDVSASGATVFIEPRAVAEESNALLLVEKQLQQASERILRELSALVGAHAAPLRANLAWLGAVDLAHAQAALADAYRGTVPQVGAEGRIRLEGLAHPAMLLAGEDTVRNALSLGGDARCLVISGANTGGKTVLLKAVGLCALLVRAGMPIPAYPGSRFDLFPVLLADVGDRQNMSSSLSTFSAQVRFLAGALALARPGCLILVDEILTGTEPQQGASLGAAVLEGLVASGALSMVTTHYGDLKALAAARPGMVNASVSFDLERLRPTFRLRQGMPGASYAFPIARRHGLPEPLVAGAEQRLASHPAAADALLLQLHQREASLQEREAALHDREAAFERERERLLRREQALGERERHTRREERGAIGRELRAARAKIAAVIRDLQRANSLPLAQRTRERLDALEREIVRAEPPRLPALTPEDLAALAPGTPVYLPEAERAATLEAVLKEGRAARVRLGVLTLDVEVSRLARLECEGSLAAGAAAQRRAPAATGTAGGRSGAPPPPARLLPGAAETAGEGPPATGARREPPFVPSSENSLDLRGMRLEEALEQCDRFFDHCIVKHVSPVLLIHGHGTGRLRAGLRARLKESPYVAELRPGRRGEGSDGVTVVTLSV
ncbi:MAG: Smr/MutS family protein [Candidatus Lambdaproteobacteria bacterium]|nr:Smr/MutS family protein [Candidatus Lambdaproteobacteria bacterium]